VNGKKVFKGIINLNKGTLMLPIGMEFREETTLESYSGCAR
jgi:hypothetical protein